MPPRLMYMMLLAVLMMWPPGEPPLPPVVDCAIERSSNPNKARMMAMIKKLKLADSSAVHKLGVVCKMLANAFGLEAAAAATPAELRIRLRN